MVVCHTRPGVWPSPCGSWLQLLFALAQAGAQGEKVTFKREADGTVHSRVKEPTRDKRLVDVSTICRVWADQRLQSLKQEERHAKRGKLVDPDPAPDGIVMDAPSAAAAAAAASSSSSSSSACAPVHVASGGKRKAAGKLDVKFDYVTDIEAPESVVRSILAMCPAAVDYGAYGHYTLERYLPRSMRTLMLPGGDRRRFPVWFIFLSPPVHGVIQTAAHMDGHGELLSMQIVPPLSNAEMVNRVAWWSTSGISLDPQLNAQLLMADTGGSGSGGSARWQYHHAGDAAMRILQQPPQRGGEPASVPSVYYAHSLASASCTLVPDPVTQANVILHPPGCIHRYEKQLLRAKVAGTWSVDTTPLVGMQCTSMLLGHDEAAATSSLAHMCKHADKLRAKGAPTTPTIDLPLFFAIFLLGLDVRSSDSDVADVALQQQHRRALQPFIRKAVQDEAERHAHILVAAPDMADQGWTPDADELAIRTTCVCERCRTHILYYRYHVKNATYCGRCVTEQHSAPTSWATRFQLLADATFASMNFEL